MFKLLLLVVVIAVAGARVVKRSEPQNAWFDHLVAEKTAEYSTSVADTAHKRLCCNRIVFQEDLTGEPLGEAHVSYDLWWLRGLVMLSVEPDLTRPAQHYLTIGPQGLVIDGMNHGEMFVRIHCAYPCCLESLSFVSAPHAYAAPPSIFGSGMTANSSGVPSKEAVLLPARPHAEVYARFLGGVQRMGIPTEHTWSTAERSTITTRYDALNVCEHDGAGMYVHVVMPTRAMYAIPELDICFPDADLNLDWDNTLCTELDL
jgi:hypothetical protein